MINEKTGLIVVCILGVYCIIILTVYFKGILRNYTYRRNKIKEAMKKRV